MPLTFDELFMIVKPILRAYSGGTALPINFAVASMLVVLKM
jgi:hypothetical protein